MFKISVAQLSNIIYLVFNGERHEAEHQTKVKANMNKQEAVAVLTEVKSELGRNYKSAIREAWMTGDYGAQCLEKWAGQLQRIRNTFGPSWLVNARA